MDAIAAHQFGYANVVAAMGTAVTEQQIGLVKRLSRNIVLALDADAAGQGATVRSLEMLPGALDQELTPIGAERDASRPRAETMIVWQRRFKSQISIVRLPEGKDPDELIRRDPASWPAVVASAQPFLDFYIDAALSAVDLADAPAKSAAVRRLLPLLEAAGDQVVQAHYAGIIARKLQLPESSVLRELRRSAVRSTAPRSSRRRAAGYCARVPRTRTICWRCCSVTGKSASTSCRWCPMEVLADARNRELLRVLQDPEIPLNMAAGDDRRRSRRRGRRSRRSAPGAARADPAAVPRADRARRAARPDPAREGAVRLPHEPAAEQHRRRRGDGRSGGAERSAPAAVGALRAPPAVLSAAQPLLSRYPGR